jgi:hypothetical protein
VIIGLARWSFWGGEADGPGAGFWQEGQKKSSTRKTSALYKNDAELPCCLVQTPTKFYKSLAAHTLTCPNKPLTISEKFFADIVEFPLTLPQLIEQRGRPMSFRDGRRQVGDLRL